MSWQNKITVKMFLYFGGRKRSLKKRYENQKGQSRMDNQETLPTLGTPQSRKTK
jgi:hypothetical protein